MKKALLLMVASMAVVCIATSQTFIVHKSRRICRPFRRVVVAPPPVVVVPPVAPVVVMPSALLPPVYVAHRVPVVVYK